MELMHISVNNRNIIVNRVNGTDFVYTNTVWFLGIRDINCQSMIIKCGKRQFNTFLHLFNRITLVFSVISVDNAILYNHSTNRVQLDRVRKGIP